MISALSDAPRWREGPGEQQRLRRSKRRPPPPPPIDEVQPSELDGPAQKPTPGQPGRKNSLGGGELMRQIQDAETSQQVHVSNGMWGWSKMALPLQGQLATAGDAAMARLAEQMKPQEVSNTLLAYANGGWQLSSGAAAALQPRLEQVLPEAEPQQVSNSLWAAAKLGLPLSGSLKAAFVQVLLRIIPAAKPQELANSLWACGTLGWSPGQRILAAAVAAMQQVLPPGTVKPQELNNFLWGLAELQDLGAPLPAALPALLEAAAAWAVRRWGQLSALDVVDLCYNLARLGHRPSNDWIGSATARCLECIAAGAVDRGWFGSFIWACSSWSHRLQRSELEQLVPAAVDSICADWPEPGRGGALRLVEAMARQEGFRVGPDHPAATAALEARLLPLVLDDIDLVTAGRLHPEKGELPYLAGWASCLAAIGLRLPEQQLKALCSYVRKHLQQLSKGCRKQLRAAFETWGYQPGLALLGCQLE
ncbi:Tbc2 translation chloroplastic [Chlorella sorokiniana]|uniref:Tbc2 translation chloroplastic n=1 Tax=Chlorella sorokiniana TaxID=3076 RepID=A0A2P6U1N7_CHLSO|nr:Tbc2 translation chloroplastic [Chlorella sorokiniana]|eukprot:PRW60220.1 Tbc2 translation chloroplastic [Chlorella sorokiniana]